MTFDITTQDDSATVANNDYAANTLTGQAIPEGSTSTTFSVQVNGDTAEEPDESFFVNVSNVTGATEGDVQGLGTIANDDTNFCAGTFTPIYQIQGSGAAAAITGNVTTQGVVVGDFEGSAGMQGFYLQDATGDSDATTSDGIFVFTGAADTVSVGDVVRVTGFARERFNQTALNGADSNTAAVTNIVDCGTGSVTPVDVTMPFESATYLERFEGMLVRFPQPLVISEYFDYERFGELVLALPLDGESRPFTPTSIVEPGAPAQARALENSLRRITLDDGLGIQNPSITRHPNGDPFSLTNRFRGGDTVANATGVLGFDFSKYRIHPTAPANYIAVNTRPAAPEAIGGNLRVAAMNTLNFFLTLDTTASDSGPGPCGGNANLDCRGADADQPTEFTRQRDKLLAALSGLDADIIGLNELENTPGVDPLGDPANGIVAGLNAMTGVGPYSHINTGVIGTDAIRVGLIYRSDVVAPVGDFKILNSAVDPRFLDTKSRPALAQTFEELATGARFTVVVNHLKSKGSACTDVGDPDAGDGQGNCNGTRTLAAQALVDWLATDPTGSGDPDFLIMGDLNSYAQEDPIDAIKAGPDDTAGTADDYINLIQQFQGTYAYSYTFDGQAGYLDHALASASLAAQVAGAADWHINSDEPDLLDYDTSFKSADQDAIYEPNAYRSSDHDPVIVGLNLTVPDFTLQLLHYYGESGLLGVDTAPIMGALIDKFDDEYSNTLVLGEGDSFIPGPWLIGGADPSLNSVPGIGTTALGRPDIAIMNAFGTDASALGNHEFDLGSPVLQSAIQSGGAWPGAQFPLITANLNFSADSSLRGLADASLGGTATNAFAGQEASAIKGKIAPYAVVTVNGEKIGLVGATTYELLTKTSPNGTVPKDDGNPATDDLQEVAIYLQAAVDSLEAMGVDKIIMVDQLDTLERNKDLAGMVSGIDVMIAGGGHERMGDATDTPVAFPGHSADFIADAYPIVETDADGNPVLIVTTDTEYTYLGRMVVNFDANGELVLSSLDPAINGAYASTESNLQAAYDTTQPASQIIASSPIGSQVNAITQAINNVITVKDGTVWGFTNVYLEGDRAFGRAQEVNLGNITADANIFAVDPALTSPFITSLKNSGGLRASIGSIDADGNKIPPIANPAVGKPAGGISTLDIENALRFDNKLMVFDTTPQGLKAILEYAAGLTSGPPAQNGGFMQIGGMRVSYDVSSPVGSRIRSIALYDLNGNFLAGVYQNGAFTPDAPATIQMVSLNFTANGGDGYPIKANADNFRYVLNDGTLTGPVNETLDFTAAANVPANALGEQKSFQNYLQEFHDTPANAYNVADTPVELDERIQILPFKPADTVFPPSVTINQAAGQADPTGLSPINFTVVFSKPVTGFDASDVVLSGTANATSAVVTEIAPNDGTTYNVAVSGMTANGTVSASIPINAVNGGNTASTSTDNTVTFTNAAPTIAVAAGGMCTASGGALNLTVNDAEGNTVTLTGSSSNTSAVPNANIVFGGSGANRTVTITALPASTVRTAVVTISVSDGISTSSVTVTVVVGTNGNNTLTGTSGANLILGLDGNDTLNGLAGHDVLCGGAKNDALSGGDNDDTLDGGAGNDALNGGNGNDRLSGNAGNDSLTGGAGADFFSGGPGNDANADYNPAQGDTRDGT